MGDYLFVVETPSIKKYVFGTDKLKEMIGASEILKELNEAKTERELLKSRGGRSVEKVFANGGAGQFILRDWDEDSVQKAGKNLEGLYARETEGGSGILWAYVLYEEANYKRAVDCAHYRMQTKREAPFFAAVLSHLPFGRDCDSCSEGLAIGKNLEDWLCGTCLRKRKAWDQTFSIWKELCQHLGKKDLNDDEYKDLRPPDFEKISKYSRPDGYIGIVYADGNAMSKVIKKIPSTKSFLAFSATTDWAIKKATFEAVKRHCPEEAGLIPVQILILGGDDLVLVLPADRALEFAILLSDSFTRNAKEGFAELVKRDAELGAEMDEVFQGHGLTISIGVAIGKHSQPFRLLLDQAEGLLKLAKKKGSQEAKINGTIFAASYIDFHVSKQAQWADVETIRNLEYKAGGIFRTMRPFSLEDARKVLQGAAAISKIPSGKIQRLYAAVFQSEKMAQLETIRVFSRLKLEEREIFARTLRDFGCYESMPWKRAGNNLLTMVPDIIEIMEFVRTK